MFKMEHSIFFWLADLNTATRNAKYYSLKLMNFAQFLLHKIRLFFIEQRHLSDNFGLFFTKVAWKMPGVNALLATRVCENRCHDLSANWVLRVRGPPRGNTTLTLFRKFIWTKQEPLMTFFSAWCICLVFVRYQPLAVWECKYDWFKIAVIYRFDGMSLLEVQFNEDKACHIG